MSSTLDQRRKKKPSPSLPYDLLLSCIARVSRLYYPTLSLVSKSFRSLLVSPELYKVRSLLGKTESCLYVCIKYGSDDYRWFNLCRKPDQSRTSDNNVHELARVPSPYSPPHADFSSLVAVGSNIYNIGGSRVSVLDCQSHTWREGPNLPVKLRELTARVVDQKIYVSGISIDGKVSSFQVLDTNVQVWNAKPVTSSYISKSASIDGKLNLVLNNGDAVAYNPKEGKWEVGFGPRMGDFMFLDCYCEIDNILYSAYQGAFRWYNTTVGEWRFLKGLVGVGLPKFAFPPSGTPCACVRLVDYGGKMAAFWVDCGYKKKIWCVVIGLERRESGEIWGEVEWFGQVLTVPRFCGVVKVLSTTV